ncbi:MAG: PqqD family protein [Solirubrobacterales bacterium]
MPTRLDPQTQIARKDGLIVESLSGQTVMLDPEQDRYLRLNETGGMIWDALAEPRALSELAAHLAAKTGIDSERAATDATAFVRRLLELGAARIEGERP